VTEYTVALRNMVSGPAKAALSDAEKLRSGLQALERQTVTVRARGTAAARGSAEREETAKRNAAFRRLMQQQREEQRLIELNIRADRRRAAEHERNQARMLAATQRRLRAEQRAAMQAHRESVGRWGRGGRAVGGALQSGIGIAGGVLGAGLAAATAGGAYIGSQALSTAQVIENARMRLTAQLGSKDAANAEIMDSLRIAEKTIFDPDQVIDAVAKLAINFKDGAQRRYILGAVSDFATATGKGNEGLESAIRAISQIAGKGKLQQEELTGQLGELGLSATDVYKRLAVMLNLKDKDEQTQRDKVIKAITAGKVGSNMAIQAITDVMRQNKDAGSTAATAAGTLTSLLSNIQKGFLTLFAVSDIEGWPAMVELKALLKDIAGFFSVDSVEGRNFMGILKDISTAEIVPFLRSLRENLQELKGLFNGSAQEASYFVRGLFRIADIAYQLARVLTYPIVKMVELLGMLREWEVRVGADNITQGSAFKNWGIAVAKGFAEGVYNTHAVAIQSVRDMVSGVKTTTESDLQIKSPSRVMMRYGEQVPAGFAMGMDRGTGAVERAASNMAVSAAGGAASGVGARGGGAVVNNYITLPVTTASNAMELVREAGPMLGAVLDQHMDRYFARQLAQGGA
jgi:tape measure domain-containing protein